MTYLAIKILNQINNFEIRNISTKLCVDIETLEECNKVDIYTNLYEISDLFGEYDPNKIYLKSENHIFSYIRNSDNKDIGFSYIKRFNNNIEILEITNNEIYVHEDKFSSCLMKLNQNLNQINHLDVSDNFMSGFDLRVLFERLHLMTNLKYLNISNNNICNFNIESFPILNRLSNLQIINISNNLFFEGELRFFMQKISFLTPNLKGFINFNNNIGNSETLAIYNKFPFLQKVVLSNNGFDNDSDEDFISLLISLKKLEYLVICENIRASSKFFETIGQLFNLLHLQLKTLKLPKKGKLISLTINNLSELTHLDLSDNFLNDDDARDLSTSLKSKIKLEVLNLSHNEFSNVGANHISKFLSSLENLKELKLSYNQFGSGHQIIFSSLKFLKNLINIEFESTNLKDSLAIKELSSSIKILRKLRYLNLKFNNFDVKIINSTGEFLKNLYIFY